MNISEIAKLAGVSVSAVSRYLNNGYISDEKKKAIREVIEKTGYQPSQQARILRTKRSKVIGVIVPKISSESVSRMVSGMSSVLSEHGYQMLLADTENDPGKEITYLNLLNNNPVDGILFIATIFGPKHKKALSELSVPVVIVGQAYDGVPSVYHDDCQAAKEMTLCMLRKGRKRIGLLGVTQQDKAAGAGRRAGYEAALAETGLAISAELIQQCDFSMESGYEGMHKLIQRVPDLDGVFCATDSIAVGAIQRLKEQGKSVPQDVAVAGVGYSRMAKVICPKLATVHLHYKTAGIEGSRMLLEMIEEQKNVSRHLKLGYEIIEAQSI